MKVLILIAFLLPTTLFAEENELEFIWNRTHELGSILDMHFAPNHDYFYIIANEGPNGSFEKRETLTGNLIESYSLNVGSWANFEFTPDSTKLLIANDGNNISVYDLETFTKTNSIKRTIDSINTWVVRMVVDPIRPYVYIIDYNFEITTTSTQWWQVSAYNYETMELVKHFTDWGHISYGAIDVSHDGRYLAFANSSGITNLQIWDLNTMELYRNLKLNTDDNISCGIQEIVFSEQTSNRLYFTGGCTSGISKYGVFENKVKLVIDDGAGAINLFDNENRVLINWNNACYIINIEDQKRECMQGVKKDKPFGTHVRYSKEKDIFIGGSSHYFALARYHRDPGTVEFPPTFFISPNPATEFINIETESLTEEIEIYNMLGTPVLKAIGSGQIDVSGLPRGVYFVKIDDKKYTKLILH